MAPSESVPRVVITGGGTGGHLFPGIAAAQEFQARLAAQVTFLTTPKGVTAQILERYGIPWEAVSSRALQGKGLLGKLRTLLSLPVSILSARGRLKKLRPHLVLGMGGYASGPVGLAAARLKIPLAIHEQNAVPGTANRWLSRWAQRIFLSFPDEGKYFPPDRALWTGNPIRAEFFQAPAAPRPGLPFTVMIMGGSQGAHTLNMSTLAALPLLKDLRPRLHFLHLTGEADYEKVDAGYHEADFSGEVAPFTPEVAAWMGRAHLLVCRAGASTLAELTALGRAAILVPYPFAANNHQEVNARFLARAGAGEVVLNKEFTGQFLAAKIRELAGAPELLAQMEAASRSLAKPDAAKDIVQGCLELI